MLPQRNLLIVSADILLLVVELLVIRSMEISNATNRLKPWINC